MRRHGLHADVEHRRDFLETAPGEDHPHHLVLTRRETLMMTVVGTRDRGNGGKAFEEGQQLLFLADEVIAAEILDRGFQLLKRIHVGLSSTRYDRDVRLRFGYS